MTHRNNPQPRRASWIASRSRDTTSDVSDDSAPPDSSATITKGRTEGVVYAPQRRTVGLSQHVAGVVANEGRAVKGDLAPRQRHRRFNADAVGRHHRHHVRLTAHSTTTRMHDGQHEGSSADAHARTAAWPCIARCQCRRLVTEASCGSLPIAVGYTGAHAHTHADARTRASQMQTRITHANPHHMCTHT
jgi:hypothetical protein